MKKLFILLLLFSVFVSNAQNTLDLLGLTSSTPASVAYSLRKLSSSYAGPLVRIKVGTSFYDVYPESNKFSLNSKISASISTYNAAVSAAGTNALSSIITAGSTNATVAIWYDQSGNGIHVYSSSAGARIITSGSINSTFGRPTVYFSGGTSPLSSSSNVDYSALSGATVNAVAQNVATTSGYAGIIGTGATPITYPGYNIAYSSPSSGYASDGDGCGYGSNVTSTDLKIVTNIFINNTNNLSKIYVNNVLKTNIAVTSSCNLTHTSGSKIFIGVSRAVLSSSVFIGNISEAIIFPSQLSDEVRNTLETNQNTFYFSPLVSVSASATNNASCSGASVTFTSTTYNFKATPTYQWYKNSVAILGATSSTYTTTTLSQNDVIQVTCSSVNDGSVSSSSITWTINDPSLSISVTGDGCANKSSLSATTGLSSYAWYKDNVVISGATTSSYTYPVAGDYKVTASNGTCTGTSAVTTISICGVTADGKMSPSLTSTKLVSIDGAVNSGKGVDERGLILTLPWAFSTVTTSTGKTWIDRNLGASRVATSSTDALGYGDYYQWGRPADGHQTKYYTNNNSTGFTNTRSTTSVPTTDKWIAPSDGSNDWLSTSDNTLWTGLNPVNNPCPSGYRIPTEAEWEAERITWSSNNAAGGYLSPLKLTVPGMITGFESNGATYTAKNLFGQYLTQSAYSDGGARYFGIEQNNAWFGQNYYKSHGMSVRCISK